MGIAVTREVYGGVLRAKPIKHPHPYPLSRQIPMNLIIYKGRKFLYNQINDITLSSICIETYR
jgi:hypothetical protein